MQERVSKPGYAALRRFRRSARGAEYFVTTNLHVRGAGLDGKDLGAVVRWHWQKLELESRWQVRTAVIMPDHLHLLVQLTDETSLSECMRLFKGRLTTRLRLHQLQWQEGYYDHEVRESEDRLPIFLYIFLNPYRAGLLARDQVWPGYFCCAEDWDWFGQMTEQDHPMPEWLA